MKAILEEKGKVVEEEEQSVKLANGKVYINGIEGFWSYAKERLLKFQGVSKDNFIYYPKELEFRYNFRDNIDDSLYKCLGGINLGIIKK